MGTPYTYILTIKYLLEYIMEIMIKILLGFLTGQCVVNSCLLTLCLTKYLRN